MQYYSLFQTKDESKWFRRKLESAKINWVDEFTRFEHKKGVKQISVKTWVGDN